MFNFHEQPKFWRNLGMAVAVAIFLAMASCSNQPENQASNQAPNPPAKPPANNAATPAKQPVAAKPAPAPSKEAQPPQLITLPKGTPITATVAQTLATDKNHPGDSFAARLSTPVKINGKVVIPKGAQVTGRVVTVKKHELKVVLASLKLHGKSYDLATNSLRPSDVTPANNATDNAAAADKANKDKASQDKANNDKKDKNATLRAQTQLTFKLAKPVTVSVKG